MSNTLSLYEKNQRVRTLSAILWIVLIASAVLGQFRQTEDLIERRTFLADAIQFAFVQTG